ncbi:hypothetical protein OUZ56_027965 [Daphnia magna]|uniref:Uncharacterized protein n=1 Tax=Daphnia magna TaxID=35525 RepID=A0ABR0B2G6_9CRUS|nr:hypothetical protein OUZ56_027965 [Daphnia magna]
MPTKKNPRLPSCLRDPSRRLHPLRELSSVPVETSPIPASSLESGTSFVGEALNFEGPIPKDHLTKEADSQGESVETSRGLYSDPETEVDLRAAMSPVVPVGGQQFIVPSRHIEQPQRQAMEAELVQVYKAPERVDGQSQTAGRYAIAAPLPWPKAGGRKLIFSLINLRGSQKISTVGSPVLKKGDLSRVKRDIGYLFAEMSHPLLGQSCDRGEEIIGRSPLQERYADMQSGRGVIRATV